MRVTKDTPIIEVLQANDKAKEVFERHGMGCIGCMGATESIERGARMHGIEVEPLIAELNRLFLKVSK